MHKRRNNLRFTVPIELESSYEEDLYPDTRLRPSFHYRDKKVTPQDCEPILNGNKATGSTSVQGGVQALIPKPSLVLEKFFTSPELADITIVCGNEEIPAHRFVINEMSPVFATMFETNMAESAQRKVQVPDVDPEVMKEFLRFIYTGEVHNFQRILQPLYVVADKYMVDRLKTNCLEHLLKSVSIENAIEMYYFGDLHRDDSLKKKAMGIVKQNKTSFLTNPETTKQFAIDHPNLMYEIL